MKKSEAELAASEGADELEMVPNFFALHQGKTDLFTEELSEICAIGLPTRIIIDMRRLPSETLALTVEACIDAGARGIQTGSGFGQAITQDQIVQLNALTKGRCSIKAVGGITSCDRVFELITAGGSEIGTTVGPEIMKEFRRNKQ